MMTERDKRLLIFFIKSLITTIGETQFYEGKEVIEGKNINLLIDFIKKM